MTPYEVTTDRHRMDVAAIHAFLDTVILVTGVALAIMSAR
jgi:hypothetical protein